jgi:hypothetical protein
LFLRNSDEIAPAVRWASIALLIVTWLRGDAVARPQGGEDDSHDRDGRVRASEGTPWIDLGPALVLERDLRDEPRDWRLASGIGLAGVYAGFWGWAYLAWYRNHPVKEMHDVGRDGWFGVDTYAGGADKLGHAWATMVLARSGTALLRAGGWKRTQAAIASTLLAESLFLGVEIKDYFYYEFSPGDFTCNTLGAIAGLALDLSPRLDELVDFRVQAFPSTQYLRNLDPDEPCEKRTPGEPSCSRWNIAEDYSGQTYLLAFHLGGIHALRDMKYGAWSRFVDLAVGFETRNYKPPPRHEDPHDHREITRRQELFVGLTFNAQGLFDYLLPARSKGRKALHGFFEVINAPFSTVGVLSWERTRNEAAPDP